MELCYVFEDALGYGFGSSCAKPVSKALSCILGIWVFEGKYTSSNFR